MSGDTTMTLKSHSGHPTRGRIPKLVCPEHVACVVPRCDLKNSVQVSVCGYAGLTVNDPSGGYYSE